MIIIILSCINNLQSCIIIYFLLKDMLLLVECHVYNIARKEGMPLIVFTMIANPLTYQAMESDK